MRCPDPKANLQCSPPVIADPEVPGASWVLCHAWIQTMPHARALSIDKCAAEHATDDANATYQHVGSHEGASNLVSACPATDRHAQTGSNGGRYEEEECVLPPPSFSSPQVPITRALVKAIQRELLVGGPGSNHATSVKQWRSDCRNATTSDFVTDIAESLEPRSVKQLKSKLVPMPCLPRTGSIPIERDYAMLTQYPSAVSPHCPSANQWKRVYDSLEKTKLPRPPQSISDCSRIHKVVRRPSNGSTFIPIQGKPAGPDAETAPYVVTDESSDSSGGKSVETDTSAENLTRSSESGSDSEIMARDSVSQASSNSVGVHDYREDSGFAKRDYRFAKPAPRHGKSDKRDMKPTNEHYNILGVSLHTDVESAKEAFIGKVGQFCTTVL